MLRTGEQCGPVADDPAAPGKQARVDRSSVLYASPSACDEGGGPDVAGGRQLLPLTGAQSRRLFFRILLCVASIFAGLLYCSHLISPDFPPHAFPRTPLSIPPSSQAPVTSARRQPPPTKSIDDLIVIWDIGSDRCTGWFIECLTFVVELRKSMPNVGVISGTSETSLCPGLTPALRRQVQEMAAFTASLSSETVVDVFVSHKPPDRYPRWPYKGIVTFKHRPRHVIGRSMWESFQLPSHWTEDLWLGRVDEIWVPARFLVPLFEARTSRPVHVVPECVLPDLFVRASQLPLKDGPGGPSPSAARHVFRFLSVFKTEHRKGWDILVNAFLDEFSADVDRHIELHLHTYLYPASISPTSFRDERVVREFYEKKLGRSLARVSSSTAEFNAEQMQSMYETADVFVLPSRGEGWNIPAAEAMFHRMPVIVTRGTAMDDFVRGDGETGFFIPATVPAADDSGLLEADAGVLRALMRHMASAMHRNEVHAMGLRASQHIREHFMPHHCAAAIRSRLEGLVGK